MTRRYPAYKDSGVEWLGEVPEGWEIKKLKHLGAAIIGLTYSPNDVVDEGEGILVLRSSNVQQGSISLHDNVYVNATIPEQLVTRAGDILICSRNGSRALIGKNAVIEGEAVGLTFGAFMTLFRSRINPYLSHVFNSYLFESQSSMFLSATINQLTSGTLLGMQIPLPPLPEQRSIAAFLDQETAKIDALVAEQRRLIDLLREKRQAVISHAVTKGLNPKAPMKPSGIDWLGDVPEGWEVVKLSAYFKASKGPRGQTLTKEYCGQFPGEYPVYSGQTDNLGVMGTIDDFDFDAGDEGVLFSTTVGAKAMTVSHILGKFSLSQNCMIISPTSDAIRPRFYFHHFQPLFSYCRSQIPDHMQPSFRMSDLYEFKIGLPPQAEQDEIASNLDALSAQFDGLITTAESAIALLQERRAALISAAVTGKIDVRHLGPHAKELRCDEVA